MMIQPKRIRYLSQDMLREWIEHTCKAFQSENRELVRRAIRQSVAKIVTKDRTRTLHYTFPLEGELYMSSVQKVAVTLAKMNVFPRVA
jgi:5-formyltetrahydrofolate cyclo-ligase